MSTRGSVQSLFGGRRGRGILLVLATLSLVGCFVYLGSSGAFLAIPDLLFFGLALPIYSGWKRPRDLALFGLAAMLISVPISSALALQYVYQPLGPVDAPVLAGANGPLLQGAVATPYTGSVGASYIFNVTLNPRDVPVNASGPLWVELWISPCPGATGPSDPYCNPGYALIERNQTVPAGLNTSEVVSFKVAINDSNIWTWQLGTAFYLHASNDTNLTWVFLNTPAQGPIVGTSLDIYGIALEAFFVSLLVPGIVFYVGLIGYVWLKRREAARKALEASRDPGPGPSGPRYRTEGSASPPPAPGGTVPAAGERACPNCGAVVYPNESTCWKCGAALTAPAAGTPLRSK